MIISNSSPLIALDRINQLNIFKLMFGEICIPDTVYQETVTDTSLDNQREAILAAIRAETIKVVKPSKQREFNRKIGMGEQGVLNLALEKNAVQIIMDDKRARKEAIELGLTVLWQRPVARATRAVHARLRYHLCPLRQAGQRQSQHAARSL